MYMSPLDALQVPPLPVRWTFYRNVTPPVARAIQWAGQHPLLICFVSGMIAAAQLASAGTFDLPLTVQVWSRSSARSVTLTVVRVSWCGPTILESLSRWMQWAGRAFLILAARFNHWAAAVALCVLLIATQQHLWLDCFGYVQELLGATPGNTETLILTGCCGVRPHY
jgi:hypothetical protein